MDAKNAYIRKYVIGSNTGNRANDISTLFDNLNLVEHQCNEKALRNYFQTVVDETSTQNNTKHAKMNLHPNRKRSSNESLVYMVYDKTCFYM